MMKSLILLPAICLMTFSSLAQGTVEVPLIDLQSSYRGCCSPVVLRPAGCSRGVKSTPTIYTEQVVQRVQRSEEVLDITDPEMSSLTASPNPTKGRLTVSVPSNLIGYEIVIVDMTGRFVGEPIPITGTTEDFTIAGESGAYLLVIQTEKELIKERIILNTH